MTLRRDLPTGLPPEKELQVGFGEHVEKRTFDVPAEDAPPYEATTKFAVLGTDYDRQDGLDKASGRAKYSYDVNFPGMLQAMILRSPVAKGVLKTLELDECKAMPGVAAVIALKEPGKKIRFVGDEIAAVAAPTLDLCRDAIERIRATYEQEEHIVDFLFATDAPVLDDHGEITDEWPADEKLDPALAQSASKLAATYRTEVQTHSSLETHGAVAKWNGDDLELWMSTQATFGVRGEIAAALQAAKVKCTSVVIHAEFVGGGFGSKFTAGAEGRAVALLAKATQTPVKLMLDRFEEHTCTGNRPAALMQFRAGVDKDGLITAFDARTFGGCGHNAGGPGGGGGGVALPDHYFRASTKRGSPAKRGCSSWSW